MSSKQKDDLNLAILDYFEKHGFSNSFQAFKIDANIDENVDRGKLTQFNGLLEKKWTLTTRLQQKVLMLEEKVEQLSREAFSGAPSREKRQPDEWIPRPPERFQLNGHRLPVTRVIFHPVFNVIASSSEDCTIKVWDFESGEFERSLKGHTDSVQDINFNSNGKLLVSCSADMSIKIWDFTGSYDCLKTLRGHDHNISSATFLPSGDFVLSASRDKLIKLWDVANGYCVQNFSGHSDWVRMIRVNHNGTYFASCSNDKTIKIWCLATKALKVTLTEHEHVVECILWVPDIYVSSIINLEAPSNKEMKMNGDIEVSQTQSVLISGSRDKTIRFWDVYSATCLFILSGHENWVRNLRLHPAGKYLISVGDDKKMKVWSIEHKRVYKDYAAHGQFVTSIDFHPKLPYVVTSSVDTTIKVWECR